MLPTAPLAPQARDDAGKSASSRFWLSLALASTFSMLSSIPTIARFR